MEKFTAEQLAVRARSRLLRLYQVSAGGRTRTGEQKNRGSRKESRATHYSKCLSANGVIYMTDKEWFKLDDAIAENTCRRTPEVIAVEHRIRFLDMLIEHELDKLAMCNVDETFCPNEFAVDKDFYGPIRHKARETLRELDFERKSLELKLKTLEGMK